MGGRRREGGGSKGRERGEGRWVVGEGREEEVRGGSGEGEMGGRRREGGGSKGRERGGGDGW